MTVLPNGDTIITDEPTMMDLPKDTVIYNEEQTKKIMENKVHVDSSAKASSDNNEGHLNGTITTPDGEILRPLQPGDEMYDMMQKFQNYFSGLESRGEKMYNSALADHQKQMEQMVNQITNNSNVINNNRNVQPVVNHNQIHVTLPNVTDSTCAQELLRDLQSINLKKFQVNW